MGKLMRDEGLIAWIGIAMTQKRFGYLILPLSLVLAATLVLTACDGGSDRPGPSPAVSSTSQDTSKVKSPSPNPNPTRSIPTPNAVYQPATLKSPAKNVPIPAKPPEADEFSEKGLKAFALYWFATFNYAAETGSTSRFQAVTQESCGYCNKVIKNITTLYAAKGWNIGGTVLITSTQMTKFGFTATIEGAYQILVQSNQSIGKAISQEGNIINENKASVANGEILDAKFLGDHWVAVSIGKIT